MFFANTDRLHVMPSFRKFNFKIGDSATRVVSQFFITRQQLSRTPFGLIAQATLRRNLLFAGCNCGMSSGECSCKFVALSARSCQRRARRLFEACQIFKFLMRFDHLCGLGRNKNFCFLQIALNCCNLTSRIICSSQLRIEVRTNSRNISAEFSVLSFTLLAAQRFPENQFVARNDSRSFFGKFSFKPRLTLRFQSDCFTRCGKIALKRSRFTARTVSINFHFCRKKFDCRKFLHQVAATTILLLQLLSRTLNFFVQVRNIFGSPITLGSQFLILRTHRGDCIFQTSGARSLFRQCDTRRIKVTSQSVKFAAHFHQVSLSRTNSKSSRIALCQSCGAICKSRVAFLHCVITLLRGSTNPSFRLRFGVICLACNSFCDFGSRHQRGVCRARFSNRRTSLRQLICMLGHCRLEGCDCLFKRTAQIFASENRILRVSKRCHKFFAVCDCFFNMLQGDVAFAHSFF